MKMGTNLKLNYTLEVSTNVLHSDTLDTTIKIFIIPYATDAKILKIFNS
jgi:hypothetical protein